MGDEEDRMDSRAEGGRPFDHPPPLQRKSKWGPWAGLPPLA
jgi:hypothetical protein